MNDYELVIIKPKFIGETIKRTKSRELMDKSGRNYVGFYNEKTNWYIPLRAWINPKRPKYSYFETPFKTNDPHFRRPGLDFQKALYVPKNEVIKIENLLPVEQSKFITENIHQIQTSFEKYVLMISKMDKTDPQFLWSTIPFFSEGIKKIQDLNNVSRASSTKVEQSRTSSTRVDLVKEIEKIPIRQVAKKLGMELISNGRNSKAMHWKEHDSFVIDTVKNIFYWNSQGFGGNAINLVETINKTDFKGALKFFSENDFESLGIEKPAVKKPFSYSLKEHKNINLAREFLKNERGLSDQTIDFFEKQGLIKQTSYTTDYQENKSEPVVVFKHFDPANKVTGYDVQGVWKNKSYGKREHLKRNQGDGNRGLTVQVNPKENAPINIVAFESPIDLMSYYELFHEKLENTTLVSMNGLKKNVISTVIADRFTETTDPDKKATYIDFVQKHPELAQSQRVSIQLAVDNDPAGKKFVEDFGITAYLVKAVPPIQRPGKEKTDWNDALKEFKRRNNRVSNKVSKAPKQSELNNKINEIKTASNQRSF